MKSSKEDFTNLRDRIERLEALERTSAEEENNLQELVKAYTHAIDELEQRHQRDRDRLQDAIQKTLDAL